MGNILVVRDTHNLECTLGKCYLDGNYFCETLEDVIRGQGIKIHGETGIPAGEYDWKVSYSSRFKRDMIMIYNKSNGYELESNGISFKGIRMHGGNTNRNTEGCILVAYKRLSDHKIYSTAEKALTDWAKEVGGRGKIVVKNS